MSQEFNPTRKDLLTIESRILDIKSKKQDLIAKKIGIQDRLGELNGLYSQVEYMGSEFHSIKSQRTKLKSQANEVELKIKGLNDELNFKNKLRLEVEYHLKHNKGFDGNSDLDKVVDRIISLKKKYSDFAKDRTRISSLRIMANEIIHELDGLLKS